MTTSRETFGGVRRSAPREFGSAVWTIMVKELRSRMRGRRAFVVLTIYLALLALITYGVYAVVAPAARAGGQQGAFGLSQANASALVGQYIFSTLSVFQIVLVSMIAPAFTAGQISLEREKQTLELLISTPLRPGAIVIGKLVTALAFVVLMIVAAIPITAIVLMYGGASVEDVVRQQVVLLSVAIGFGALGIFASALTRRTQAATVLTYSLVLGLTLGSAMIYAFWSEVNIRNSRGFAVADPPPEQLRYLNPMVAMLDVVSNVETTGPTRLTRPLYELFGQDLAGGGPFAVGCEGDGCGVGGGFDAGEFRGEAPAPGVLVDPAAASDRWWPRVSLSFLGLAAVMTLASMRLMVPEGMRWGSRRRRRVAPAEVKP